METFRQLTLADKPSFDRHLVFLQPETSDLTFTNLLMWQHNYGLQAFYDNVLDYWILWCNPPKWRNFFLPPIGDWSDPEKTRKVLRFMEDWAREKNFEMIIRRVPQRLTEVFHKVDSRLVLKEDRNTFDYVYQTRDLTEMAGRKFHGKRNHLNQFLRKYQWEYQQLDQALAAECLSLETEWFNVQDSPEHPITDEERAMALVLWNFNTLGVSGGVIRIDGKIQALAVGEKLNASTAVTHIEKANTEFDGMYTAICQQFAADFGVGYEYINREEDMGIEGLRKSKLSYQPVKILEKFSVRK